ncbi:MAG TPA: adenylosuccinate lyase [Gammaproteobacteria bacterium]|nr:adenylosuccinate lyase [Gammaproteobacteria bacterium]
MPSSEISCIGLSGTVDPTTLTALSPLDGRYARKAAPLRPYLSEFALIRYRVLIEVRWLQHLADEPSLTDLRALDSPVKDVLNQIVDSFSLDDANQVKTLESETNHDVKAVEYYLRQKLDGVSGSAANIVAFLHFASTSEDINNLAYALMLRDARQRVLLPVIKTLTSELRSQAHRFADVPMLARTHGQAATPTTLGKELANFVARLDRQSELFAAVTVYGKFNGAVGNFNAHMIAYPKADWLAITDRFLESLGLATTRYSTQIEPHDWIAEYCQALSRCNTVTIDLCRDAWGYISLGYFRSRLNQGEVGSSTMPHKVNPIEFENAEGNLGLANELLGFLATKLPISRWQRDLTDSTVLRNLAVALGHTLIALDSCQRGLGKLEADPERIAADLAERWEVLAEAVQTVMRRHGVADAYERLKELTRGRPITGEGLREFIRTLEIPEAERKRLLALEPSSYTGLAQTLARDI